jgi:hypothetical protein
LLSTNNRDLGRAAVAFPDVESCMAAVLGLKRTVDVAVATTAREGWERWGWRLSVHGVEVAMSSRSYQRRVQAEYTSALFLQSVPAAEVPDSPTIVAP